MTTRGEADVLVFGPLDAGLRRGLEQVVIRARDVVETGVGKVVTGRLGVGERRPPTGLTDDEKLLRRAVLAKRRQTGSTDAAAEEIAFGLWHRMLFARFLAENRLLMHPELGVHVSLAECAELAETEDSGDVWTLASRFASKMLPGLFPQDDPLTELQLLPEDLAALEGLLDELDRDVFTSDDGLGWMYQFWQSKRKDQVNASEVKIGARELPAVTQLFTEHYMVRFLLENSLGAWWAARHPDSSLIEAFDYLRFTDDGQSAAGRFKGWPATVAEVTVMDPCCGSGHFLTTAFEMLWRMRVEEEDLPDIEAQDAVLRDNLFGLELDPRCVQIAMMAVALQAWKAGGGWRELPVPNIACSGIPVKAQVDEWKALADDDERLEKALVQLHILFRDADTLGSLIDPKRATEITDPTGLQQSFEDVEWEEIAPLLVKAASRETGDPATAVLGADAAGIARAADYLGRRYTLVTTNPPFLVKTRFGRVLRGFLELGHADCDGDLASAFVSRCVDLADEGGTAATVSTENWLTLGSFQLFRKRLLSDTSIRMLCWLGDSAFSSNMIGTRVRVVLSLIFNVLPTPGSLAVLLDVSSSQAPEKKAHALRTAVPMEISPKDYERNPDSRFTQRIMYGETRLGDFADSSQGICTGDNARFGRFFWELPAVSGGWEFQQSSPKEHGLFAGRSKILRWEDGKGELLAFIRERLGEGGEAAWVRGLQFRGRNGIAVMQAGNLKATPYIGDLFDDNTVALVPRNPELLPAVHAYVMSGEFEQNVRVLVGGLKVADKTMLKVPFDLEHWRAVAEEQFPDGLPEPYSNDPTQWLFLGNPTDTTHPLQVAVARLLGYSWPDQQPNHLDELADRDGIVCIPPVLGEQSAAQRLQHFLIEAFQPDNPTHLINQLLSGGDAEGETLEDWLRDFFFKQHCKLFRNRPFIWHIWDGNKNGFSALVNYHKLDRDTLKRLTNTYLKWWITRQQASVRDEEPGAEARLTAALELQAKLELILEGEPPYDIYVRWKPLHDQPIGWEPDLNDGVRLNVRPFVEAGVLRSKFTVKWGKDRGKNPDGTERRNNLHHTRSEKQRAREVHAK